MCLIPCICASWWCSRGFIYSERSNMQCFSTSSISLTHNPWTHDAHKLTLYYTQVVVNYIYITQYYWLWTEESVGRGSNWSMLRCHTSNTQQTDNWTFTTIVLMDKALLQGHSDDLWSRITHLGTEWLSMCTRQLSVTVLSSSEDRSVNNVHAHLWSSSAIYSFYEVVLPHIEKKNLIMRFL